MLQAPGLSRAGNVSICHSQLWVAPIFPNQDLQDPVLRT
jgi:hypothetical protein